MKIKNTIKKTCILEADWIAFLKEDKVIAEYVTTLKEEEMYLVKDWLQTPMTIAQLKPRVKAFIR
jgi:hypothetical protein